MEREMGLLLLATAFAGAVFLRVGTASVVLPAIYVFGDSSVDVGNNNFLPGNQDKANFLPYGIDFPGRKPTGRFSNGYVGVDFFAKELGFGKSPPAYLSIVNDEQAHRGANFASGGSGILDTTSPEFSVPLNKQLRYFRRITRRLRTRIGGGHANRFLAKSILFFRTGSNDMFTFTREFGPQNTSQQDLFVERLSNQFKNQLETLYGLGARKFLVLGSSLIGCIPTVRLIIPSGECLEYLNSLSQQFNRAIRIVLHDLASNLKDFSYSFVDVYGFDSLITSEPQKYGFTNIDSACCGSGRFNAESGCNPNSTYCSDRDKYFFWDATHHSQASYKLFIRTVYCGKRYATPITIKQLVRL